MPITKHGIKVVLEDIVKDLNETSERELKVKGTTFLSDADLKIVQKNHLFNELRALIYLADDEFSVLLIKDPHCTDSSCLEKNYTPVFEKHLKPYALKNGKNFEILEEIFKDDGGDVRKQIKYILENNDFSKKEIKVFG